MSSGQISIIFPIRVGAQVAAVKSEILRQLKRVTADNGTLSVQVSTCLSIHNCRPPILQMMAELLVHSRHPAALSLLQRPITVCTLPFAVLHRSLSADCAECVLQSEVQGAEELVTFNMAKLNLKTPAVAGVSIASKLTIQMRIPQQESARPSVKFLKQGALTDDELSVFSAALRAANKVTNLAADAAPAPAPPPPVSPCHAPICPAYHQGLLALLLHGNFQWLVQLCYYAVVCKACQHYMCCVAQLSAECFLASPEHPPLPPGACIKLQPGLLLTSMVHLKALADSTLYNCPIVSNLAFCFHQDINVKP